MDKENPYWQCFVLMLVGVFAIVVTAVFLAALWYVVFPILGVIGGIVSSV